MYFAKVISKSLAWLGLSLIFVICTSGQARVNSSGTGGINTIQGQIFAPNGKLVDMSITVRLKSVTYGDLTLITDLSGGFSFRNLAAGNYEVSVTAGDDFEPVHEYVTIDPDIRGRDNPLPPTPKVFSVPIYLQLKRRGDDQKTGVLDARLANVPKDALKYYKKAGELVGANKNEEAIAELKLAVNAYPAFSLANIELGKLYLKTGKVDLAINALEAALGNDRDNFEANVTYGVALLEKSKHADARKALMRSAEINTTAVTPHYYLGMSYVQEKDLDSAQKELETAEKLGGGSKFPLLHRWLGGIYLNKKMTSLAVKELEAYLALDPKTKDADRLRNTIAGLKNQAN